MTSKFVRSCAKGVVRYANIRTGANFLRAASTALKKALGVSGMTIKDIHCIGATGWGGRNLKYATNVFDEVHCHAKGARFMFGPKVHTVVDMGGQTVKAIRLYDWDRVRDFMMNDKCATGMGRNIEFLCDLLQVPIEEIGRSPDVEKDPEPVATSCYVFANSETMGLFGDRNSGRSHLRRMRFTQSICLQLRGEFWALARFSLWMWVTSGFIQN